ncbi:hypothetical protein ANN_04269 [Periplaneta americana]|uniref:DNA-dependent protein kinase catalytic subunit CC1/2 domain-containing protein n=1 Tax=Periplaneta americana TaxID=6978 RepID=A0ABQ8TAI4_PERAM|nr:hypothetical protein ANN_04269 [Periplaneta americana]
MAGLCEGGNEPLGSLKAICNIAFQTKFLQYFTLAEWMMPKFVSCILDLSWGQKGAPNQCEHDGEQIVKDLFSSLVEGHGDVKRAVLFQPRALVYAESLLKFAFLLKEQVAAVLSCIKERAIIQNPATHLPVSHGDYFLVTFKSAVLDHLLDHSENTMNRLLVDLSKDNVQWMLRILTELLHYLAKSKKNKQKEREQGAGAGVTCCLFSLYRSLGMEQQVLMEKSLQ